MFVETQKNNDAAVIMVAVSSCRVGQCRNLCLLAGDSGRGARRGGGSANATNMLEAPRWLDPARRAVRLDDWSGRGA